MIDMVNQEGGDRAGESSITNLRLFTWFLVVQLLEPLLVLLALLCVVG